MPLKAVQEARAENKYLKNELLALKASMLSKPLSAKEPERLVSESEEAKFSTFRKLTKAEFTAKYDDDIEAGQEYLEQLQEFVDYTSRASEQKRLDEEAERQAEADYRTLQSTYERASAGMEALLPGLFDEDSTVQDELAEFASSIGFEEDLFYLTSPETRVILPGETEPVLLGEQAVDIMRVLVKAREQIKDGSVWKEKMNAAVKAAEKATEKRLRKQIEKELLSKFKDKAKDKFTSLDDISDASGEDYLDGRILSEAEMLKMPAEQYEKYLKGQ